MKKQGYLYWGNVQNNESVSGKRPFLVLSVQNNNVIVAPLRSLKSVASTHIPIKSEWYPLKDGSIFLEEVTFINEQFLQEEICSLRDEDYRGVKETLISIFSLNN